MTDKERIEKLEQAIKLIREVEFSYPPGNDLRLNIYRVLVSLEWCIAIGDLLDALKKSVRRY